MLECLVESCFKSCLAFTATEEGGYVDDPRDSGNWTSGHVGIGTLIGSNRGVGAPALLNWMGQSARLTAAQMHQLPFSTYEAIAHSRYWTPLSCAKMPAGVDLMLFDFGWNRGIGTSLDLLARCLTPSSYPQVIQDSSSISTLISIIPVEILLCGISNNGIILLQKKLNIQVDGIVGPQTISEFKRRKDLQIVAFILSLATAQTVSYKRLSNFAIYGAGWLSRTNRRQSTALANVSKLYNYTETNQNIIKN